ncbi:toxin-antitoxin system, toxin component [Streptomyces sp. Da 82-17]|uniref:toxin-antitoxin system, toxin component n=1 Tax=Streptomyces sp. Da 82-17 TaxID=3377116 RepID=UPI0038D41F43
MRKLCADLLAGVESAAPARPQELHEALCAAMSRRRGRPLRLRTASFPPGTASGLWLDMTDQDLIVIEERTAPDHQLVILGHELWHMEAGHTGQHVEGAGVAARLLADEADLQDTVLKVAARTRFDHDDEADAESFGLLLASRCRTWLTETDQSDQPNRDRLIGRIEASLGHRRGRG